MKKNAKILIIAIVCYVAGIFLCACYNARYDLESCAYTIDGVSYTQKYVGENFTAHFDSTIKKAKTIDGWIDTLRDVSEILEEKGLDTRTDYFVGGKTVAKFEADGDTFRAFLPAAITKEESLAWAVCAKIGNGELPYGVYAGVAANWLNEKNGAYSVLTKEAIKDADYLTELQFPLYESGNLDDAARKTAWNFSYTLVRDLMSSGKSERELMSFTRSELSYYLASQYQITLPDYEFFPYDNDYEYRVEQGCFTYYINREYRDLVLPKEQFSTSYDYLSDWLKDNQRTKEESDAVFKSESMYDINVYLDDGKRSYGRTGEAFGSSITLYSVGSFSHEYIHHILFKMDKSGYLSEVFPELQANNSKYSNLMWYYLFSGKSSYPYSKDTNEKATYQKAMQLYNKKSAKPAVAGQFDFWLFADCFSSLYTNRGEPFINRLQSNSLHRWIADTYGADIVWQLNTNNNLNIDGKTYNEISYEWLDYLKSGNFE